MADIAILADPLLLGFQPGAQIYVVEGDVLRWFANDPTIPAQIAETQLRIHLAAACANYAATTNDAVLASHLNHCRNRLMMIVGNNAQSREMVGEILAAAAIEHWNHVNNQAWYMAVGYTGHGHTGIDQIWYQGNEILVVEAKGGQGRLDDTPRYFNGTDHQGHIGFQGGNDVFSLSGDITQLSPGWVFIGCDRHILDRKFVNAMLNGADFGVPVLSLARRLAVLICLSLWRPDPLVHSDAPGNFQHDVGLRGKTVAPTTKLNSLMGWNDNMAITLPKVSTLVIVNGKIVRGDVIAEKWTVFTATRPGHDDGGSGGGPHRFKPGLYQQLQNAQDTVY